MRNFTAEEIIDTFKKKGFPLREKILEMNIYGIRNTDPTSNYFDDIVGVLFKDFKGNWTLKQYTATTDPGEYARLNPMNLDGTAIIVPGFHIGAYKYGKHKGEDAMEQIAPMVYVRDANKNKVLDFLYKTTGFKMFKQNGKTNIHRAGEDSKLVDKWSYGCQVIAKLPDFMDFIGWIRKHLAYGHANVFDYTLFEVEEVGTKIDKDYFNASV